MTTAINRNKFSIAVICLLALLVTSCSFAPLTPRVDAASIGKGVVKVESNIAPSGSLGVLYGASDNLDVGMEIEQLGMGTVWTRYSFINNPTGFSLAGNAGVFAVQGGNDRSNGWYAGLLMSNQLTPKTRWSAGYRHAILDYEYDLGDDGDWFSHLDFNNPDDASVNGQLEISVSYLIKPHFELAVGGICQYLLENTDPEQSSEYCLPIIGLSFYRL